MKQNISTTPEQSRRLLACGVDPNTADMCWLYWDDAGEQVSREEYLELYNESFLDGSVELVPIDFKNYDHSYSDDSPAWSLSALLALLPTEIKEDNCRFDEIYKYSLMIYPYMQGWQIDYQYCKDDECHGLVCIHDLDLIGACVKIIEWLTANGYKLNEI